MVNFLKQWQFICYRFDQLKASTHTNTQECFESSLLNSGQFGVKRLERQKLRGNLRVNFIIEFS